jgi:hypothetical protein
MLVYLTDVRSERVVIIQVNWVSQSKLLGRVRLEPTTGGL